MPKLARDYQYDYDYSYRNCGNATVTPLRRPMPRSKQHIIRRKKRSVNPIASLLNLIFAALLAVYVLPFSYQRITVGLFNGGALYPEIKTDYYEFMHPTANYLSNDLFLNQRSLKAAETKKPEMTPLYPTESMPVLEAQLRKLMNNFKTISPAIYVWEFDSGKFVDINADKTYSAASIIKIPVLIQLFKSIEANQLTIYDEMYLTSFYQSPGSGSLQYKPVGLKLTVDELAREMITDSDNTATNMLVSKMGSMTDVNQGLRNWGIKHTQIKTWLPDLNGNNYTTAKDMATMLYNLDNPSFLNINSRESIIDYMSHVKNNRLIQAGLGEGALFVHKTGDIGKMLGDAGIVFAPNGKKYIVVILANRPYNSPLGRDFIQQASSTIYKFIMAGKY